MSITSDYISTFIDAARRSSHVSSTLANHGYFRHVIGDSIVFLPIAPKEQYHSIAMSPGFNQSSRVIECDASKSRVLLLGEACNSSGDYVILEDHTKYLTLTGFLKTDVISYCQCVINAIVGVTGQAESLGMTPHDYVHMIAD